MRAETKAYSLIALLLALIVASLVVVIVSQPAEAREIEPDWTWRVYPTDRTNTGALLRMKMDSIEQRIAEIIAEREAEQAALEAEQAEQQAAYYYEPTYYAPSYDASAYPTDGLTPQSGVNAYNGRVETYYSSNVLYHYNTAAWTVDDEGFYRTDEGYYVVAASDMPQGTTFETSKGTAQVLDSGCAEGVTDFYTRW